MNYLNSIREIRCDRCKYYRDHLCTHPQSTTESFDDITGEIVYTYMDAVQARQNGPCFHIANLFEVPVPSKIVLNPNIPLR